MKRNIYIIIGVVLLILLADQGLKIWVKTNMVLGESSHDHWGWSMKWFQLYFIENPGMAFGMKLGDGVLGKIILTLVRVFAIGALGYYLCRCLKYREVSFGFVLCVALVFAGALGNIIDCIFYGVIFEESMYHGLPAQMFPAEGYAPWLQGKVVDMLYFPMIDTIFPDWFPIWGGRRFIFFSPIFNIADSSVFVGSVSILIFFRHELNRLFAKKQA